MSSCSRIEPVRAFGSWRRGFRGGHQGMPSLSPLGSPAREGLESRGLLSGGWGTLLPGTGAQVQRECSWGFPAAPELAHMAPHLLLS